MSRVITSTEELMTPAEVAAVFGVQAKTVAAWARAGRLDAVRTLGGHRRYRREDVQQLLSPRSMPDAPVVPTQRAAQAS